MVAPRKASSDCSRRPARGWGAPDTGSFAASPAAEAPMEAGAGAGAGEVSIGRSPVLRQRLGPLSRTVSDPSTSPARKRSASATQRGLPR